MIIGVDPHKASVTIEVVDQHGTLAATGRFPTARGGYQALIRFVRQWPQRVWAVEGTGGAGRPSAPAEASGATTERISARARRLSTLVSTRNVNPTRQLDRRGSRRRAHPMLHQPAAHARQSCDAATRSRCL